MLKFRLTALLRKLEDAKNLLSLLEGSPEFLEVVGAVLEDLHEICTELKLGRQLLRQIILARALHRGGASEQKLRVLLELLIPSIEVALVEPLFFIVPPGDAEWFTMTVAGTLSERFGAPLADDLDEAGKCFALERYTVSVFHSMRVVECLLRELV